MFIQLQAPAAAACRADPPATPTPAQPASRHHVSSPAGIIGVTESAVLTTAAAAGLAFKGGKASMAGAGGLGRKGADQMLHRPLHSTLSEDSAPQPSDVVRM